MKTEEIIDIILTWLNGNIVSLSDFRDTIKKSLVIVVPKMTLIT